jgi:hypothetical protein
LYVFPHPVLCLRERVPEAFDFICLNSFSLREKVGMRGGNETFYLKFKIGKHNFY